MGHETSNRKRGRPIGFRLSEISKRQISISKKGQKHKQETKNKISKSLLVYFKRKNPLSEEIINSYCRTSDDEVCGWAYSVQENLDNLDDVKTERTLYNDSKRELAFGDNIECFGHELTPELLLMLSEYCINNKLDISGFSYD